MAQNHLTVLLPDDGRQLQGSTGLRTTTCAGSNHVTIAYSQYQRVAVRVEEVLAADLFVIQSLCYELGSRCGEAKEG